MTIAIVSGRKDRILILIPKAEDSKIIISKEAVEEESAEEEYAGVSP